MTTTRNLDEHEDQEHHPFFQSMKRVDGPWSWTMCALFFVCNLLAIGCISTYGILFPSIMKEFSAGRAITAIPASLSYASSCIFGPVIGRLCDRYGCRKAMLIGGVCCALGLVLSSFARAISVLVLSYGLVLGVGLCFVYFSSVVAVAGYFKKYKFESTSVVLAGPMAGMAVMTPLVQLLYEVFEWRKVFLCVTSFSMVPLLTALLMRSPKRTLTEDAEPNYQETEPAIKQSCGCRKLVAFSVLKIKVFVLTAVVNVIVALGHLMSLVHLAKFGDDIGISSELSSWLYLTVGITATISRLLVSKFGKTGCLTLTRVLRTGIIVLAIGNFILPSVTNYHGLILYCIMYGIGDGFYVISVINLAIDYLPDNKRGGGFGLFQFFVGISYICGPVLSGFIADISGSYIYAFYTAGSLELLGAGISLILRCFTTPPEVQETEENICLRKSELKITEKETVL